MENFDNNQEVALNTNFNNLPTIVSTEETISEDGTPVMSIVHLDADGNEHTNIVDMTTPELDKEEARDLTNKIRTTTNVLYLLIARAHAGKAHIALGYNTFEEYIREEFNYSKSYAYKLINQANVIKAIEAVTPEGTQVYVSDATARGLKASLEDFIPELEERLAERPDEAGEVIEELIAEYKERQNAAVEEEDEFADDWSGDGSGSGDYEFEDVEDPFDGQDPAEIRRIYVAIYNLFAALQSLNTMPDTADIIANIQEERVPQVTALLEAALPWLINFNEEWKAVHSTEDNSDDWNDAE
jgi:hypothetical protein